MLSNLRLLGLISVLSTSLSLQAAAQGGQTCNITTPCPGSAPCCSDYGFCGTGSFCLGGCNPLASHSLDSCMPNPVCQNATHTFADNSRILSNATYFGGNASAYDWVVDKGNIINTNSSGGELGLILTQQNGGTKISSTRYVHYGNITTRMKTGRWQGVVSAFITMSDVKDEIDWEFPGNQTTEGQTNYFWEGVIPPTTDGQTTYNLTDTYDNYHDYNINWQPDTLTFSIDGNVVRTVHKSDTLNSSTGIYHFPQTPSRIQLSLWPAGINTSAPGTIQWAGGMINWQDPDYVSAGHFYSLISSVTVQCSDPVTPASNVTSYVYGTNSTTDEPSISFSTKTTINAAPSLMHAAAGSVGTMFLVVAAVTGALLA